VAKERAANGKYRFFDVFKYFMKKYRLDIPRNISSE
jgi:hypothetical protein